MRKNFVHAEKVNIELMWLHALGFSKVLQAHHRNNGVVALESKQCGESGLEEVCTLGREANQCLEGRKVRLCLPSNARVGNWVSSE